MKIVVLKFGGTSVGTIEKIKKVTDIIIEHKKKKNKVIVVSSAMSGVTNDLIKKSKQISNNFIDSEYDVLVSSGEQVACSLIAGRLNHKGFKSRSWLGWQIPIFTNGPYTNSRIQQVNKNKLLRFLKEGGIPIITGFQGVNMNERVTTIGRGGSDASAIMIAKFFKAQRCIIYTDVEGVYTTDPNKLKKAKKIKVISYEEMLEMASLGAKVMQPVSIQDARLNRINIEVKSSFIKKPGTLITKRTNLNNNRIITGISSTHNDAKVTLVGVKDRPGVAASIFKPLSINSINVDMVVQNISPNGKETDLTFTIKAEDLNKTKKIIQDNKSIKFKKVLLMFQALANKKINIQVISTSEIKISVLINKKDVKKALVTLHKEFKLQE